MRSLAITIAARRYRLMWSHDATPAQCESALKPQAARLVVRTWARQPDGRALGNARRWLAVDEWEGGRRGDAPLEALLALLDEQSAVLLPPAELFVSAAGAPPPSDSSAPPPSARDQQTSWFEVTVVDEAGEPIGQLPCTVHADVAQQLTTGVCGKVRLEHTRAARGNFRLTSLSALRDAMKPRWDQVRAGAPSAPVAEADTTVLSLRPGLPLRSVALLPETPHTVVIRPWVERVRLLGGHFDTNKCFVLPSALDGLRAAAQRYFAEGDVALLVVGHTDVSADAAVNDPLSGERAAAVRALLAHDVDVWLRRYKPTVAKHQRWGRREDGLMLRALPDDESRPALVPAVRWFQRTRGLTVDGWAGPETRQRLIAEYFEQCAPQPVDVPIMTHGCGENFPIEDAASGGAECDRRVELFVFDHAMGLQPSPPAGVSGKGCKTYPEWVKRARHTDDYSAAAVRRNSHLSYVLLSAEGGQPLSAQAYRLWIDDGEPLVGETDVDGLLEYGLLPADDYRLDVAGETFQLPALDKSLTQRPLIVRQDVEQ